MMEGTIHAGGHHHSNENHHSTQFNDYTSYLTMDTQPSTYTTLNSTHQSHHQNLNQSKPAPLSGIYLYYIF